MSSYRTTPLTLRPIFVDLLPETGSINDGELWISHKHRAINLRCPCGCGHLTVLSLLPSRWHVYFDGEMVSLCGPTGGSVWANYSGCGSHYFIRNNTVIWARPIDPDRHDEYAYVERERLLASQPDDQRSHSWLNRIIRALSLRKRRESYDSPGDSRTS